jgi:hypothetical protein
MTDSKTRKETPIYSGVMAYFPDAIEGVARVSFKGNAKHNGPGTPLKWTRGKSNDHPDCIARHLATYEEVDPEDGELHVLHLAWRALALAQETIERRRSRNDVNQPAQHPHPFGGNIGFPQGEKK